MWIYQFDLAVAAVSAEDVALLWKVGAELMIWAPLGATIRQ
jgi:hypothetical protein